MKKIFTLMLLVLLCTAAFSQSPQRRSHDPGGGLVETEKTIDVFDVKL